MNISIVKVYICTLAGIIGTFLSSLFGGWSDAMITLLIFMVIDFAMGILLAGVFKNSSKSKTGALDSHVGWKGLCKKGTILAFVMVAHRLDVLLGTDYIRTTAIIGFILNEGISIVENAGRMGVPLPEIVVRAIESLKEDTKNENNYTKL